jgi:hypothetical protein
MDSTQTPVFEGGLNLPSLVWPPLREFHCRRILFASLTVGSVQIRLMAESSNKPFVQSLQFFQMGAINKVIGDGPRTQCVIDELG